MGRPYQFKCLNAQFSENVIGLTDNKAKYKSNIAF